ncbi:MAG TPA: amino acid adenylation domain-containing protein, partial [Herpetosiphonaceae bacterium]
MSTNTQNAADLSTDDLELLAYLLDDEGLEVAPHQTIVPRPPASSLPLSFAQQRLWFFDQLQPGSTLYTIPVSVRIRGNLDLTALQQSLNTVIQRHEILRTSFGYNPADAVPTPYQQIAPAQELVLTPIRLPSDADETTIQQAVHAEMQQAFDLRSGPLLRVALPQLAADDHILVLIIHHSIFDGWSRGILLREMIMLYEGFAAGRPIELSPLPIQYADYALWQRQWLESSSRDEQLAYWRNQLAAAPVLDLPLDYPRPPVMTFRGQRIAFQVPAGLTRELHQLSQQLNSSLFMTLLAVFQVLRYRYSGETDIAVGTPIAGRNRPEFEDVIGLFANTLVLRTDLAGRVGCSFTALIQHVREVCLAAYANQTIPFELLVEELQPERDPRIHPFFQVLFVLQNAPTTTLAVAGLSFEPIISELNAAKVDLSVSFVEVDGQLEGSIEYRADLFAPATMERLAQQYLTLLHAAVADPQQAIAAVSLLSEGERNRLLGAWNPAAVTVAPAATILELIEAQVARSPDAVALIDDRRELTYRELDARANQVAHDLRALGIGAAGAEARVGLCVARSLELIVGLLGIWKAGAAYVPLDPDYPQERLHFMLADAQIAALLTEEQLLPLLPPHGAPSICLDRDQARIARQPSVCPPGASQPESLAYIIYTSGSTGQPKGVMISHRALASYVGSAQQSYSLTAADRVLQFASITFDASVEEIATSLASGATLVLRTDEMLSTPDTFFRMCETWRLTVLSLPTAYWQLLAEHVAGADRPLPQSLRLIIIGGERVLPERVAQWLSHQRPERARRCALINTYGPTETTVVATAYSIPATVDAKRREIPIGHPLAHVRAYVLDRRLQLVPIGGRGELYLGGDGLARGYLRRPALTAERFIPDPFSRPEDTRPGARLYRTGDLARYRDDGTIEFLGRNDHQIKLRGFRVEPGEIEAALRQHEQVREALVVLRDGRLVAYVTQENQEPRTENLGDDSDGSPFLVAGRPLGMAPGSTLREFLAQRLPAYMVPSAFVLLDALPLTPSGKIDRQSLPKPNLTFAAADQEFVAPRTELEELIAGVWTAVLGVERVGVHDNFFRLGGHSLLATQVITRLRHLTGRDLPLRLLFEAPTVAAFAAQIGAHAAAADVPLVPLPRDGRPLPLSFAQHRLWFLHQLEPRSTAYHLPTVVRLFGALDVDALQAALTALVQHHEVLRTVFADHAGQAEQVILPHLRLPLAIRDVPALPEDDHQAILRTLVRTEVAQLFDLERGPLLRALLLRCSAREHVLVLTLHHIVTDGWSQSVLLRELTTLYRGFAGGAPIDLPALPIQYADYALWQRQWLQGQVLESQLGYWKQQLADVAPLDLPLDRTRPPVFTEQGAQISFQIPAALSADVRALSQQHGATPFMTLLAALEVLLARYSHQTDIAIGTPIAGRVHPKLEGLIGFFVNTLVLRTDLADAPSFAELVARVRTSALDAYAHQDVPFELVVEAVQPERDLSRHPLFQVMFAVQNLPRLSVDLPDLRLEPFSLQASTAKFDLALTLNETPHGFQGVCDYRTDLFDATTIERLVGHYLTLLTAVVADPQQPITIAPLLTAAERDQILHAWNTTALPVPQECCLHQLFEAQAARTSEAIALRCGDDSLTYVELNARANQLAHHLQGLGVTRESLVGLCLDRSLDLVIGLLAILKAGVAYVPLDPDYPPERLAFIVADAQIQVLVTQTALLANVPAYTGATICLDRDGAAIAKQPRTSPAAGVEPQHTAYVIYTSGSTGQPKGVLVEHRQVVNTLWGSRQTFGVVPTDTMPWLASVAFDIALFELFMPLLAGGTSVIVRREEILDLAQLDIQLRRCTLLHAVPTLLRQIVRQAAAPYRQMRRIFVGGEAVPPDLLAALPAVFPSAETTVLYGPTEATIICTSYSVPRDTAVSGHPIGRPLPNHQVRLYDRNGQLVPAGVVGELYVGGAGVTRGYLQRSELTQEKYVILEGTRWYRTGDLARYRADGVLEFLGRIDHQVKLRGFRIELEEIEAVLRQHHDIHEAVVVLRDERLVAYVVEEQRTNEQRTNEQTDTTTPPSPVATDGYPLGVAGRGSGQGGRGDEGLAAELRQHLGARLPEYMVPRAFVVLDALPLTVHGKLDRKALPDPDIHRLSGETDFVAPRTPAEVTLARIWADVLGIAQVGIHDNFFALGGDSILTIQIIARARQAGLQLLPKQVFEHQTIARLAVVAGTPQITHAEQGLITGPVPLTPIQHAFFALDLVEPHHFNQAVLLQVQRPLDPELLEQAAQQLIVQHDALRLRYARSSAVWQQQIVPPDGAPVVLIRKLAALPPDEQSAQISATAAELHGSLNLSTGPLIRAGYFDLGVDQPARLLVVIHHLAVDTVSWPILLADLQSAYSQLQQGAAVALPPKTTSFKAWAEHLVAYAQAPALHDELEYWLQAARHPVPPMPVDLPDGHNTQASVARARLTLSAADTHALLHDVPRAYHTQINDVLLSALVLAWAEWCGSAALRIELEGHGREDLFDDVDLTRTVGWFTSLFPVVLDLGAAREPGTALKTIKEHLRQIPRRGIGYGVLRYLAPDAIRAQLANLPAAEVAFNYLGQLDQAVASESWLMPSGEDSGPAVSPRGRRRHLLEVSGFVVGGQLHLNWAYSTALHHRPTIERLVTAYQMAIQTLIAHCLAPDAGGYTPSDFPLAALDQATLDRVVRQQRQIEDLYPLSPMQQGLLFHTVYEGGSGVYVEQLACHLEGRLDTAAFQQAWTTVVARHPIFRTEFVWEGLVEPVQVVRQQQAEIPWRIEDWRDLTPDEQQAQLRAYLQADRRRGFALHGAPLLRLALFRVGAERHAFVWSHHHLLLDGWSLPLVFNEVVRCYEQLVQGQEPQLAQRRPFRDYIAWLQRQDLARAEAFWRQTLSGMSAPTPLSVDQRIAGDAIGHGRFELRFSDAMTAAFQAFVHQHQLTLNTLVQGAWALLLSRYSSQQDILYGVTVSGRPPELEGVEQMIGIFINTLPMRALVDPHAALLPWLKQMQALHVDMRQYEYSPLVQIHGWSDIPRSQPLFESIVVFENYPIATSIEPRDEQSGLAISTVQSKGQINYPLSVIAMVNRQLWLQITYDRQRFTTATIERLAGHLEQLLVGMVDRPDVCLGDLPLLTAAERRRLLHAWNATTLAYPTDGGLAERVAAQARHTPDAIAVICGDATLSYAQLNAQANQLAHHLQALGVGPEVRVGIALAPSLALIVGLLAVLKAGGAYVPLDPGYPQERLRWLVQDSQIALVLTQQDLLTRLPATDVPVCCLDRDWAPLAAWPSTDPDTPSSPDQLAYLIYTSGSTGTPKGVLLSQRGVVNNLAWRQQRWPLSPADRVLLNYPISFDPAVWSIFWPLSVGAQLVLVPAETRADSAALVRTLAAQRISVFGASPSQHAVLL